MKVTDKKYVTGAPDSVFKWYLMKQIKFIAFLFYRYYSTGPTAEVAYIKTGSSIVLLLFMNLVSVLLLINRVDLLVVISSENKVTQYLKAAIFLLPILLILLFTVKKKYLDNANFSEAVIKRGNRVLILYLIASFLFLFGGMFFRAFYNR